MGHITRLPEDLANQIAAGEVVERPASVIKELVENAIDADAQRLTITVEYGGKRLIRVDDDGHGMDPDDARLCLDRHATSKIRRADDLGAITTLGFRGEALPSMASVSHFRLRTRRRREPAGTEVRVNGGVIESVMAAGGPEGTSVEVADLFYNLPARRKFLKADAAESAQISRTVTQLALCYASVGFTLINGGRTVLSCPPVTSVADRLYQLYGDRPDLVPVDRESAGIHIYGFVAALADQGPTRGPQHVFVNRRIVKDKTIAHAIFDAYSVAGTKERSPEVHLFVELAPDRLDVNVHPTKAEVRFRDQSLVHEAMRRALADALGRASAPELTLRPSDLVPGHPLPQTIPGVLTGGQFGSRWLPQGIGPSAGPVRSVEHDAMARAAAGPAAPPVDATTPGREGIEPPVAASAQGPAMRPLIPLGQFRDTFIIAVDDEGLAIIDQHVAHERVLYERVMQQLTQRPLDSQRMLVPLLLDLAPAEREALLSRAEALQRMGFEVEDFGGDAVRVSATPALLAREECEAALRALASDLEGLDRGLSVEEGIKRIAALTACHGAVKANDRLTYEKMVHILEELRATAYSTVCPHGRPVMLRLSRREIEKNFERI